MINQFRNEYYFLSNFYECKIVYEGLTFRNSEAAFQAMKCADPEDRYQFQTLAGAEAKHLGRRIKMRSDWNDDRLVVMERILREKFRQNLPLAMYLILTRDEELVEGNYWGDTYWGIDLSTGHGSNHLGLILMEIRDDLRRGII